MMSRKLEQSSALVMVAAESHEARFVTFSSRALLLFTCFHMQEYRHTFISGQQWPEIFHKTKTYAPLQNTILSLKKYPIHLLKAKAIFFIYDFDF